MKTSTGVELSFSTVNKKLYNLWASSGTKGERKHWASDPHSSQYKSFLEWILALGSECIDDMSDSGRETIQEKLEQYRQQRSLGRSSTETAVAVNQASDSSQPEQGSEMAFSASGKPSREKTRTPPTGAVPMATGEPDSVAQISLSQQLKLKDFQISQLRDEVVKVREQWQTESEERDRREQRLKRAIGDLSAQIQNMEVARQDRDRADRNRHEESEYVKQLDSWRLTKEIHDMRKDMRWVETDGNSKKKLDRDTTEKAMNNIRAELESVMCADKVSLVMPKLERQSDLASLVRSVLDIPLDAVHTPLLRRLLLKFEPEYVIRAFVLAALRDWVFLTDFPGLTTSKDVCLEVYRDVILTLGE